jgi:hypothetical protein
MRLRNKGFLSKIALMAVILHLTGGHYFAVQMVAWTKMLFDYSKGSSVIQAVVETFDGRHPCGLCESLEKAKQEEKQQDVLKLEIKNSIYCQSTHVILLSPPFRSQFQVVEGDPLSSLSQRPQLPPPKVILG